MCRNSGTIKWTGVILYAMQVSGVSLVHVLTVIVPVYRCIFCGEVYVSGSPVPILHEVCACCVGMAYSAASLCRLDDLMEAYLKCFLCAPFMSFLACILVFNAWFNFTAELTRFGDREFYQVPVMCYGLVWCLSVGVCAELVVSARLLRVLQEMEHPSIRLPLHLCLPRFEYGRSAIQEFQSAVRTVMCVFVHV
jgi:hypothetical protein